MIKNAVDKEPPMDAVPKDRFRIMTVTMPPHDGGVSLHDLVCIIRLLAYGSSNLPTP